MSTSQRLVTLGAFLVTTACGGTVVFEENGGAGGHGDGGSGKDVTGPTALSAAPSSSVASSGSGEGGDITSTAVASTGVSTVGASTASGPSDPCLGLPCGATCVVCNEFECLNGFCDELSQCVPEQVCPTPTETLCYTLAPDESCASALDAPFYLCRDCGGGKGCTFFGDVFSGPVVTPGECCYEVAGECAPNP